MRAHLTSMGSDGLLSAVGRIVRRHDPDRYFTALFAPAVKREALFTLYAFNHELARAREAAREPAAALIRLQWWREVVEGARTRSDVGRHEVAGPVAEALDAGWLEQTDLLRMIEAREAEAGSIDTLAEFEDYVQGSAGGVMAAAAHRLGMQDAETLRLWGAAFGVAGVLRSLGAHARQGRCLLPLDLVREVGLSEGAVIADPAHAALGAVKARLAGLGLGWTREPMVLPRSAMSAALPVVLARLDLKRTGSVEVRPAWDRMAVLRAAIRGRV